MLFGSYPGIPDNRRQLRPLVARQLEAVFSGPDPAAAIFEALAASVAMARYWQEPDDVDVLLTDPEVSALFWSVAEAVVRHPSVQWWSTGVEAASQVYTRPDWTTRRSLSDQPVRDALRELRFETIDGNDRMCAHRRDGGEELWAMTSGTWWTPPNGAAPRTTRRHPRFGPVNLSAEEDAPGYSQARSWPVSVPDDARVFEVDSDSAWADLVRRYPMDVTYGRGANWLEATGRDGAWAIPDWHAIAADYEAVHLSVAGYLNASGRVINVDADTATFIAGWDPDTTYWLIDIGLTDDEATRWTRDPDEHGHWRPID